jgi:hypothetical protein
MRYFILALALILLPCHAQAGTDGISQLNTVTQQKADNANDDALQDAARQRGLIQGQTGKSQASAGTVAKPPKALKLPNPNQAKVKQLEAQVKALNTKLNSITGLPDDQQLRIQQMQDHMAKMMALMSNLMEKMSETQNGIVQNMK